LADRAQARWIEEFSDTRMGDVFIWRIFYEAVILPFVFQRTRDKAKIASAVSEQMPGVMDHLERIAPGDGFLFGEPSVADLAVAIPFGNLKWARVEPDKSRWPKACAWVERTQAVPALAKVTRIAEKLMQTPPNAQRAALADLGVPLTEATIATEKPRRSLMLDAV
jgi:glutathione S-transferase